MSSLTQEKVPPLESCRVVVSVFQLSCCCQRLADPEYLLTKVAICTDLAKTLGTVSLIETDMAEPVKFKSRKAWPEVVRLKKWQQAQQAQWGKAVETLTGEDFTRLQTWYHDNLKQADDLIETRVSSLTSASKALAESLLNVACDAGSEITQDPWKAALANTASWEDVRKAGEKLVAEKFATKLTSGFKQFEQAPRAPM